jgi:hypothetical protein
MKTMKALSLILVLALAGCYTSRREITYSVKAHVPVGTPINVVKAEDGIYQDEHYGLSGDVVSRKLVAALVQDYPGSSIGSSGTYSIKPQILHWEDRATEWSGKADRVKISLPLYRDSKLIGSALVSASSSWWTMGGDHPEDLLDSPFEAYAASLAGKPNPNPQVIEK